MPWVWSMGPKEGPWAEARRVVRGIATRRRVEPPLSIAVEIELHVRIVTRGEGADAPRFARDAQDMADLVCTRVRDDLEAALRAAGSEVRYSSHETEARRRSDTE